MPMHAKYPTLFSPMRIGPKVARNRSWMSAHATLLVKDHVFTDAHVAYYAERAKHGVAVITMECMAVHETSLPYRGKALSFDPRMVPQYRKIAAAVQAAWRAAAGAALASRAGDEFGRLRPCRSGRRRPCPARSIARCRMS